MRAAEDMKHTAFLNDMRTMNNLNSRHHYDVHKDYYDIKRSPIKTSKME